MGIATNFLGTHLHWSSEDSDHLSVHLSQPSFADELLHQHGMSDANAISTPYRSGSHIDSLTGDTSDFITATYQSLVGSLNWLSTNTRPDLSTVTNLLSQYNQRPTSGHLDAARYVLRYLSGTRTHGITFTTHPTITSGTFNHFPLTHADANWGPQDASQPNRDPDIPIPELALPTSRSISGFITYLQGGPIAWTSKRQYITALSSAEAEIYATSEATKYLLSLSYALNDLDHAQTFINGPMIIWNDNRSCIDWCKGTTTKRLRHMQMRDNRVRECIATGLLDVGHVPGPKSLSDIFTKEMRDAPHFVELRDQMVTPHPSLSSSA